MGLSTRLIVITTVSAWAGVSCVAPTPKPLAPAALEIRPEVARAELRRRALQSGLDAKIEHSLQSAERLPPTQQLDWQGSLKLSNWDRQMRRIALVPPPGVWDRPAVQKLILDESKLAQVDLLRDIRTGPVPVTPVYQELSGRQLVLFSTAGTQHVIDGENPKPVKPTSSQPRNSNPPLVGQPPTGTPPANGNAGRTPRERRVSPEERFRRFPECVALLARSADLADSDRPGYLTLRNTPTFKRKLNICPTVENCNLPCAGFGTAFLVGERRIVTAGHNFNTEKPGIPGPGATCVIFNFCVNGNYDLDADGNPKVWVAKDDVFYITKYTMAPPLASVDWAVAELDRSVNTPGVPERLLPAEWSMTGPPTAGKVLHMVGHPEGMPLSAVAPRPVLRVAAVNHFIVPFTSFAGNSGSPVFDGDGVVQGILTGSTDGFRDQYAHDGNCVIPKSYSVNATEGEKCTAIYVLRNVINGPLALDVVRR